MFFWEMITVKIEAFRFNEKGHWELEEYKYPEQVLPLPLIGISFPVHDIYEGIIAC